MDEPSYNSIDTLISPVPGVVVAHVTAKHAFVAGPPHIVEVLGLSGRAVAMAPEAYFRMKREVWDK